MKAEYDGSSRAVREDVMSPADCPIWEYDSLRCLSLVLLNYLALVVFMKIIKIIRSVDLLDMMMGHKEDNEDRLSADPQ